MLQSCRVYRGITTNVSGIYVVVELELFLPTYLPKMISEQKMKISTSATIT